MNRLDDAGYLDEIDRTGFLGRVERFPEQVRTGWEIGRQAAEGLRVAVDNVVVFGVGGSGISGDVLKAILGPRFSGVVEVSKGYEVPPWIGPRTLVFAVSHSGETEETIESFEKASETGALIVTVSTGGTLAELGEKHGFRGVRVEGGMQPRAALGHLVFSMLGVCQELGLGEFEGEVAETEALLHRRSGEWGFALPLENNQAKELARLLDGRVPLIYGSEGLAGVAAYRWKCQLNECSKVPAYHHLFSELNHNEVMGWTSLPDGFCPFGVVILRHAGEHPRIRERIELTKSLLGGRAALLREVHGEGGSATARLMDLTHLGDYVATYLAIARGVDPCRIDLIEEVKRRLPPAR